MTFIVRAGAPSDDVVLDLDGEAFRRYGVRERGLFLVRPDGYVATRAASLDPAPIRDYFARLASGV